MYKEGGFNLTKFSSNNLDVLTTIQDKDKKDGIKDKDLAVVVLKMKTKLLMSDGM